MLFLNRSVKLRLTVTLGACILMLVVVGLIGLLNLSKTNDAVRVTYEENVLTLASLSTVNEALLSTRVEIAQAQRDQETMSLASTQSDIVANDAALDAAWSDYYPNRISDDTERAIADEFATSLTTLRAGIADVIGAMTRDDFRAAREIYDTTLAESYPATLDSLQALIGRNTAQAAAYNQQTSDDYAWTRNFVVSMIAVSVIVGILLAIWLIRGILTPLGKAQALANAMAEGRLNNSLDITCRDEFGDMLTAMKAMEVKFSQVVTSVRHNSESVNQAAEQIAHGTEDLSSRTQQQAASIEETAASMDEITSTVRQNAANASEADKLVHDVSQQANAGGEIAEKAVHAMEGINASSHKIAGIVGLIDEIAFQTNLLALNASVEAARAGEQGRGFAVVANEVRNLAGRSANAAKEIKQLVEESIDQVTNGSQLVNQAGKALGDIASGVQRVSILMSEIATASHEQSQGIEQVNTAIAQMDSVTQQNSSLVEESSAAGRTLQIQAAALLEEVSFFQGASNGQRPASLPASAPRLASQSTASQAKASPRQTKHVLGTPDKDEWASF